MYIMLCEFLIFILLKFSFKLIHKKAKGPSEQNLWMWGCNIYKLSLNKVKAKENIPKVYSSN